MDIRLGNTTDAPLTLRKGKSYSLKKNNVNLKRIRIGLGWKASEKPGEEFDLDASVFMLGSDKKVHKARHLVYFNNPCSPCGSVRHSGDDRVGSAIGEDKDVEVIEVDLTTIPPSVVELVPTITIYDAHNRRQNFGRVTDAYIRIIDADTGKEVGKLDLTENYSTYCSNIVARIYRDGDGWAFEGLDEGMKGEIEEVCERFGWHPNL
jgi:tellurium resistance protein TerD